MGYTLFVLGCGTMGVAILSGVIDSLQPLRQNVKKWEVHTPGTASPTEAPSRFIASVGRSETATKLRSLFDALGPLGQAVELVGSNKNVDSVREADVVLLCCKPQLFEGILALDGMREALESKLLVSILAGVTIAQLTRCVHPSTRVVRAMPNTPCRIREGMTIVSTPISPHDRATVTQIFSVIGRTRFLDEKHFDACTALGGSGPAFACIVLEAMADGGVMMGLPRAESYEIAAQTLQGAARMVLQAGTHPAAIKDSVATPGGCTIAGLLALEDGKVRSTIARAIQVATERASELGQPARK